MSLPPPSLQRLVLAGALYVAAIASAVWGAFHAATLGAVPFLCGPTAEAHCWACYAAPLLAAAGIAVLLTPEARPARVRS